MPGNGQKNSWGGLVPVMNMAGVQIYEDGVQHVANGDYMVQITETEPWVKKNAAAGSPPSSIVVRARILEDGSEKGKAIASWPGITPNEGGARSWKAILVSAGADPRALEQALQPLPEMFKDKVAYVHVESAPAAEAGKDSDQSEVIWLRKETYLARKATGTSTQPAATMAAPPSMVSFQGFGGAPAPSAPAMMPQGQPMQGQPYQPQAGQQYQPQGVPLPAFIQVPPNGAPPGGMNLFGPPGQQR